MTLNEALFSAPEKTDCVLVACGSHMFTALKKTDCMKADCTSVACDSDRVAALLLRRWTALVSHVTLNEALFSALEKTDCALVACGSECGAVLCSHED